MRRAATVELIVSVVIRPNSVTGNFRNVAVQVIESEAESKKDVELLGSNLIQHVRGEPLRRLLSQHFHFERLYPKENILAIDLGKRVIRRFHTRIQAGVEIVKQAFQFRIRCLLARRRSSRSGLSDNQQLDSREITCLDIFDDPGYKGGNLVSGIQKKPYPKRRSIGGRNTVISVRSLHRRSVLQRV